MTLATNPAAFDAPRAGIGSSDAPIITGDAPWGDLVTLYAAKAGIIDEPHVSNPATVWGTLLEQVVAAWVMETTGRKVRRVNKRLAHPAYPWMRALLDRVYVGERRVLEIKTSRYATDEWGPAGSAEIPAHYVVQVQHQLAVTGYAVADVAVLFSGSDPRLYTIPRDDALIASLIELESEFWTAVLNGTPPEALVRSNTAPIIPFREGEISADETLALGIEGVHNLRSEIKERKAELSEAEEAVKTLMGPHTAARAGAYRATYRPNADSHPVTWELVAAAFRKRLAETDPAFDPEPIESLFTTTKHGNRPLLITLKEEALAAG